MGEKGEGLGVVFHNKEEASLHASGLGMPKRGRPSQKELNGEKQGKTEKGFSKKCKPGRKEEKGS